jgi:hypothetical protein
MIFAAFLLSIICPFIDRLADNNGIDEFCIFCMSKRCLTDELSGLRELLRNPPGVRNCGFSYIKESPYGQYL